MADSATAGRRLRKKTSCPSPNHEPTKAARPDSAARHPEWLPKQWSTESHTYANGRKQTIFISPSGSRHYQKADVMKVLAKDGVVPDAPPAKRSKNSMEEACLEDGVVPDAPPAKRSKNSMEEAVLSLDKFQLGASESATPSPGAGGSAASSGAALGARSSTPAADKAVGQTKLAAMFGARAATSQSNTAAASDRPKATSQSNTAASSEKPKAPPGGVPDPPSTLEPVRAVAPVFAQLKPVSEGGNKNEFVDFSVLPRQAQEQFFQALDNLDNFAFHSARPALSFT